MTASLGDTRWDDGDVVFSPEGRSHTVGGMLRAQREQLGWTLPAIANQLRIRQPFLEAIEEGRIDDLPGRAYAIGFVRTYAQALGLDPADIAQRFRAEAGDPARKVQLEFPAPVPERGVPALAVALVGVVIAIGAYAAWYRMSGNDRPSADAVQPVPDRLAALVPDRPPPSPAAPGAPSAVPSSAPSDASVAAGASGGVAVPQPVPTSPASAAAAVPASLEGPPRQAEAGAAPRGAQMAALAPALPSATGAGTGTGTGTTSPAAPFPQGAVAGPVPSADTPHVELRATADSWMRVREKGGHEYLDRVLKAGESWPVPDKPNLVLSTGNAGGTVVLVDGVAMPSLGGSGVVRHDLPLQPDALRARLTGATTVARPVVSPQNQ